LNARSRPIATALDNSIEAYPIEEVVFSGFRVHTAQTENVLGLESCVPFDARESVSLVAWTDETLRHRCGAGV
jgi:hypothetical protein